MKNDLIVIKELKSMPDTKKETASKQEPKATTVEKKPLLPPKEPVAVSPAKNQSVGEKKPASTDKDQKAKAETAAPKTETLAPPTTTKMVAPSAGPKQPTILIIDDDQFFREFYRAELSQHDLHVEFAVDGEEGSKKAMELKPDMIMLDIILPKKDGFEVLKDLKTSESTKNIPVIIASNLGNNADIKKLLDMGAANIYNKTTDLPKEIAFYIADVLKNGVNKAKPSLKFETDKTSEEEPRIPKEKEAAIFEEVAKEIEKDLTATLGAAVTKKAAETTSVSFDDLGTKIAEISSPTGKILICSEIQVRKPSLAILSIKRDDAMALIKLLEQGALGSYLTPKENDKLLENFFNIIMTALINKLSALHSGTFLSKPPRFLSPSELVEAFQKLNTPKDDIAIFLRASYTVEAIGASLSFYAFFDEGSLVQVTAQH